MKRQVLLALVTALTLVASTDCAKELQELSPFPCARDGTCPGPFACVPGVGCAAARQGSKCTPGVTDCSPAGAGARCVEGQCTIPCQGETGCGTGWVCSAALGEGGCVPRCTTGAPCPEGLVCQSLWYQGERGCLAPNVSVRACKSFRVQSQCVRCGSSAYPTIQCTGYTCPENSQCRGNNTCACLGGYTPVTCAGETCSTLHPCTGNNWWCRPNEPQAPGCAGDPQTVSGTCECVDGRSFYFGCGTTASCEERCSTGCDTVTQDCPDPATPKCTLSVTGDDVWRTTCLAPTGDVAAGSPCARTVEDAPEGVGHDNCAAGLFCSGLGVSLTSPRVCRQFCRTGAQCPGGSQCAGVSGITPPDGVCVPTCTFFSSGCGAGLTCHFAVTNDLTSGFGYCRSVGTTARGAPCDFDTDCTANSICRPLPTGAACAALCDDSHTCPSGTSCTRFSMYQALGYCS